MAAREHYKIRVVCKGCGEVATVTLSEEDHPYIKTERGLGRAIDAVEGDFSARTENVKDVVVHCNRCGRDTLWE